LTTLYKSLVILSSMRSCLMNIFLSESIAIARIPTSNCDVLMIFINTAVTSGIIWMILSLATARTVPMQNIVALDSKTDRLTKSHTASAWLLCPL
jgi:hypothetical protein